MPEVLAAARAAGARWAGMVVLRLPGSVKEVFESRLRQALPLRAERVLSRVREMRGGKLYDPRFGVRGLGEGVYAEQVRALFEASAKKLGFAIGCHADGEVAATPGVATTFERPPRVGRQLRLL